MPSLQHKERLNENLQIGVQVGIGTRGTGYADKDGNTRWQGKGVWTCEIKFPGEPAIFRTTKVKYDPATNSDKQQAVRIAYEIFAGFSDRYGRGLSVSSVNYVHRLIDKYLEDAQEDLAENERLKREGLSPRKKIYGGRNYWTDANYKNAERHCRLYLYPFTKDKLPSIAREPAARIENVKKRDLDELDPYLQKNYPQLSIETRLKIITEMRHFLHWAYQNNYIEDVPSIARPHTGGVQGARQRMRKEITPDIYQEIIRYTRDKYLDETRSRYHRDYSYLFHLWILIMSNTGIRCPTGSNEHTLIRWEHYNPPKDGKDTATLFRPDEKGHEYHALIMPRALKYFESLKKFYKSKKMTTSSGYLFRHPHNQRYGNSNRKAGELKITKGAPIFAFKTQWNNMMKDLALHEFGTKEHRVPQSERISPTSLRAWFITQRLYSDENVKIELLARCTGTSIGQIEARYLRLDMDRSYQYLTAGGYDDGGAKDVEVDGYYAGTTESSYWKGKTK
jgi:hypothetical protein